jgi:hypothetical protein
MDNKTYAQSFTITANAQSRVFDTRELNTVLFLLSGTYALTVAFEASDAAGAIWYPLQVASVNAATVVTTHSTANATQAYEVNVHSFSQVRVRSTAYTSGTLTLGISGTSRSVEPAPNVQVSNTVPVTVSTLPAGTGHTLLAAATTNATSVKVTAGNVFELTLTNYSAAPKFVKLYDKASAPTVGTDSPIAVLEIAANATRQVEFGNLGKRLGTGIAYAITGAQAIADTTAVAAGDVRVSMTYI